MEEEQIEENGEDTFCLPSPSKMSTPSGRVTNSKRKESLNKLKTQTFKKSTNSKRKETPKKLKTQTPKKSTNSKREKSPIKLKTQTPKKSTNSKQKESPKKLKTPTPKKRRSFRMSIPKDFFSRDEMNETPRSDGLDPEILDYYLNKAYKSSPAYLDLKAKRFNSSFTRETPRTREIEIWTPEEEAAFAEEQRRLYGDPRKDEEEAVAAANRFAEALTQLEKRLGINYDEDDEECCRQLEKEREENRKCKSTKKVREKKKNGPPANDFEFHYWKHLGPEDLPRPRFVENEEDLLARWHAEVEAKKKKSTPASSNEEPVAGPSYLSSFDPNLEDNPVMSTPKPNRAKSSVKKTEKVSKKSEVKGKKLASNKVPKKKIEQKK